MERPNDTGRELQLSPNSTPDSDSAIRRDALLRSMWPWLSTLPEEDVRRVDALVMYFKSRREDQRDELELERRTGVSRVDIGLAELRQAEAVAHSPTVELCKDWPACDRSCERGDR